MKKVLKNGILVYGESVISSRIEAGELNRNYRKKLPLRCVEKIFIQPIAMSSQQGCPRLNYRWQGYESLQRAKVRTGESNFNRVLPKLAGYQTPSVLIGSEGSDLGFPLHPESAIQTDADWYFLHGVFWLIACDCKRLWPLSEACRNMSGVLVSFC